MLLRLIQFYQQGPEWFIGKDINLLEELMDMDRIKDVAITMRDPKHATKHDLMVYKVIEEMRESDVRFHGPFSEDAEVRVADAEDDTDG